MKNKRSSYYSTIEIATTPRAIWALTTNPIDVQLRETIQQKIDDMQQDIFAVNLLAKYYPQGTITDIISNNNNTHSSSSINDSIEIMAKEILYKENLIQVI